MNTFRVVLADGTRQDVNGESYIAGSAATDLVVIDQFGQTVFSYPAGTWVGIEALTTPAGYTSANVPPGPVITASDPNVPGTYFNGRSVTNESNG